MKKLLHICVVTCVSCLLMPAAGMAGKGYMGGSGTVVTEPTTDTSTTTTSTTTTSTSTDTSEGGTPDTVVGPLNDKMADSGKLFGDLYVILRQQGILLDKKLVPDTVVNENGVTVPDISAAPNEYFENNGLGIQLLVKTTNTDNPDNVIGGEPVLTVIDPDTTDTDYKDYGWYAAEIGVTTDGTPIYGVAQSPYPAQCVQPIASYERWGDINKTGKTGLTKNRLPMVITYDATWGRSECAVGQLLAPPTVSATGEISFNINAYFIKPCTDLDKDGVVESNEITSECQWEDPINGVATYPEGVLWTDLIGEVHFGRLNIGRAPEAVLQAAFDEAINTINSPDTVAIKIDAAGRLLLQKNVYDELSVYKVGNTLPPGAVLGSPVLLGTVWKAIDSPLENVALYVKLMQDGHLVTPADEREPIDRSKNGGIPIWKMLELEDGPADAALRPTIDIDKMKGLKTGYTVEGLDTLVDVTPVTYWTYYQCVDVDGTVVPCMCLDTAPVQPELDEVLVACDNVVDRKLFYTTTGTCPTTGDGINQYNPPPTCEGPFSGIVTDSTSYKPDATDLNFTAAFLAAAADKTGHINQDMVVYINSILGINKVVGYSAYNDDGTPADGAIDYSKNPVYFNFGKVSGYSRTVPFGSRGDSGFVTVLQGGPTWIESSVSILGDDNLGAKMPKSFVDTSWMPEADRIVFEPEPIFDNLRMYADENGAPILDNGKIIFNLAQENILGFTQQADDDLSVIRFIHTYQIPGLR